METKNLKTLIVEDEAILSHTIQEHLKDFGLENSIIVNNYSKAKELLSSTNIDLAILDINLKGGDEGIKLAKQCFTNDILFFFVTSYTDKKTLDLALETEPGAYVVKPIQKANLYSAIKLTLNNIKKPSQFYNFKDGAKHIRLNVDEITHLKADGVYTEIHTFTKKYLNRNPISVVTEEIPNKSFIQTHRSYSINKKYIKEIKGSILNVGDLSIPISRTYKPLIKQLLNS